jgi:hypothetical protein
LVGKVEKLYGDIARLGGYATGRSCGSLKLQRLNGCCHALVWANPLQGLPGGGGGLHQQFTKAENRTIGGKIELLATWDLKVAVYVLILL